MEKKLTISKLDAARRQIETVIRLYFCNGDPVSIHTLTAASYNMLKDLNKKRGGTPLMIKELLLEFVKKDRKKEIWDTINAAENFFKHADRDHEDTLDFIPYQSEIMIYEACSVYRKLSSEDPPLFKLFRLWFMAKKPGLFILSEEEKKFFAKFKPEQLGREGYFNNFLPLIMIEHRVEKARPYKEVYSKKAKTSLP
jgi:hypothetical protein